jgi:hypothetical protein
MTGITLSRRGIRMTERPETNGLLPARVEGVGEQQKAGRTIDVLMVTHSRPVFAQRALERLLETCDEEMRVWLWHNGGQQDALEVARSFLDHPQVHRFHHSVVNTGHRGLWQPINWVLAEGSGVYFSKVDDDCLVPDGWADVLRRAHEDVPTLGVIGCWRFRPEDFRPALAGERIAGFGGHRILRNCWIEGSGFLMKRSCVETTGPLRPRMSFSSYCIHLAAAGWINGWYYPFLYQEHMDDPRSPLWLPQAVSSTNHGSRRSAATLSARAQEQRVWIIRARAFYVQRSRLDSRWYMGWRARLRRPRFAATRWFRRWSPQRAR